MFLNTVSVTHEKLVPFQLILEKWIECVQEYIDCWDGDDLPYWYNERANVSVLAGAAWRAGFTAIEEYQIKKQGVTSEKDTNGRNDLYITDKDFGVAIEAKVIFPRINDVSSAISAAIDNALNDVGKIIDVEGHKLGVVFVAPYTEDLPTMEQVGIFTRQIAAIRTDAYAVTCPRSSNPISQNKRYYPCVAILAFLVV